MSWLARLKKIEDVPGYDATKPTKPGFVGFVASISGISEKTGAADDPAERELKTQPCAAPPMPAKPAKQTFLERSDAWRELDRAYQAHHFQCRTCIAAGLGYGLRCGVGSALWTVYSDDT